MPPPSLPPRRTRRSRAGPCSSTARTSRASYGSLPGAVRRRPRRRARARCWPCSAPTAPGSPRCCGPSRGLLPPTGGAVTFDGEDITGARPETGRRAGIALMPGGRGVFPTLTVAENLRLACWPVRNDFVAVARRPERGARAVPGPAPAGSTSGPATSPAASSRCCRWPWRSSPARACCASTSSPSGWRPPSWPSWSTWSPTSTRVATTVVVVEQSVDVALLLCRAGRVPGEGPGPLHRHHRRAARPARHPPFGVPRFGRRPGRHHRPRGDARGPATSRAAPGGHAAW